MEKKFDDDEWKKFLEEEYIKEADLMEEALFSDENFPDMEMTDEEVEASFEKLVNRLKADGVFREEPERKKPEGEKDKNKRKEDKVVELEPVRKKKRSRPLVTRHKLAKIAGFVVMCTLTVFAASMTSEANRNYFINSINYLVGNDTKVVIDNDEESDNLPMDENEIRKVIEERLQVKVPEFMYVPQTFIFSDYKIGKLDTYAYLEYSYKGNIIALFIRKCDENDKSTIFSLHGKEIGKVNFEGYDKLISIFEIKNENDLVESYAAQWYTDKAFYQISGKMEKEEFEKIIQKMRLSE